MHLCLKLLTDTMKVLLICLLLFVSQIAANQKWEAYKVIVKLFKLNYNLRSEETRQKVQRTTERHPPGTF